MTKKTDAKIYFEVPKDEDGYPPDGVEALWAQQLNAHEYKIDNIPIYVREIGSGDVVTAMADEQGCLWFKELLRSSGNSVFRLFVFDDKHVGQLRDTLRGLGYESEQAHVPNLIAVEIPASKPIQPFLKFIVEQEEGKRLEYEEAALRHEI